MSHLVWFPVPETKCWMICVKLIDAYPDNRNHQGLVSIKSLSGYEDSRDRLIFNMGIPIRVRHLYIKTALRSSLIRHVPDTSWWRHQMETFSTLLAICAGNSSVTSEFPAQRPVTRSFDVFFDLYLNKRLSKQSWGWWFETPSRPLWRYCNAFALDRCRVGSMSNQCRYEIICYLSTVYTRVYNAWYVLTYRNELMLYLFYLTSPRLSNASGAWMAKGCEDITSWTP